jgi:hypothetical protein
MPTSFLARQNAHERTMDRRLLADLVRLAQTIGLLINQVARAGTVPNTRASREGLSQAAWEQVLRPYYLGAGEPLRGTTPQSPYAGLLVDGVTGAVTVQVDWQLAILRRNIRDEQVWARLTGPRPPSSLGYSVLPSILASPAPASEALQPSFTQWVDPRGWVLADRIVRVAIETRARLSRFFDYHIGRGTEAGQMAEQVGQLLTTGERGRRPYGPQGGYPSRFLLRNELIVAAGATVQNVSQVNPAVAGIRWKLNRGDTGKDQCDQNAKGGPLGNGVYAVDRVPRYPDHAGEQCTTPGQIVETARGHVAIEDVVIGDMVLTHMGRYRPVRTLWVTPHDHEVYLIRTEAGSLKLTGNHPVLLRTGWVDAKSVKPGDQVLYACVNVGLDLSVSVTESAPAFFEQVGVAPGVFGGIMPIGAIAFDCDAMANEGKVKDVATDPVLFGKLNAGAAQGLIHEDLDTCWTAMKNETLCCAEHLKVVALLDLKRFAAVFADDCDGGGFVSRLGKLFESVESGVVPKFGFGNLASCVGMARRDDPLLFLRKGDFAHIVFRDIAEPTIVALPLDQCGSTFCPHGDIDHRHQIAEGPKSHGEDRPSVVGTKPLVDIQVRDDALGRASGLLFNAQPMPFGESNSVDITMLGVGTFEDFAANGAGKIEFHNNLLSLSPDLSSGRESGNSLVSRVANPAQAQSYYSTVLSVETCHYTGKVYNLTVAEDQSYTVNGACVHNCDLLPVAISDPATLTAELRAELDRLSRKAEAMWGMFNRQWLIDSLVKGGFQPAAERVLAAKAAVERVV